MLAVLFGLVAALAAGTSKSAGTVRSPLLGRQAPPIDSPALVGGRYDSATESGRFLLVNFFDDDCIPCIREHDDLMNFEARHRPAGDVGVVSVLFDTSSEEALSFFDEHGGSWPVVLDPDGRIAVSYGVAQVPESYLVSPQGVVLTKLVGGVTSSQLDQLLESAKAEPT